MCARACVCVRACVQRVYVCVCARACVWVPPGPHCRIPLRRHVCEYFVLQVRNVFNMTAKEGRRRSVRVLVAVGNGRGAAGECGRGGREELAVGVDRRGLGSALHSVASGFPH